MRHNEHLIIKYYRVSTCETARATFSKRLARDEFLIIINRSRWDFRPEYVRSNDHGCVASGAAAISAARVAPRDARCRHCIVLRSGNKFLWLFLRLSVLVRSYLIVQSTRDGDQRRASPNEVLSNRDMCDQKVSSRVSDRDT